MLETGIRNIYAFDFLDLFDRNVESYAFSKQQIQGFHSYGLVFIIFNWKLRKHQWQ